jgi:hypothetical protein
MGASSWVGTGGGLERTAGALERTGGALERTGGELERTVEDVASRGRALQILRDRPRFLRRRIAMRRPILATTAVVIPTSASAPASALSSIETERGAGCATCLADAGCGRCLPATIVDGAASARPLRSARDGVLGPNVPPRAKSPFAMFAAISVDGPLALLG